MAKYRVSVHTGPLRNEAAGELVDKIRAKVCAQTNHRAWGICAGTETLYFDLESNDQEGAYILACDLLLATFGHATGLCRAVTVRALATEWSP